MILWLRHTVFKVLLPFGIFIGIHSMPIYAQNSEKDTAKLSVNYLPDYVKFQFAGGIGFLSSGVGYTFFNHKLDITLFYGYVPKAFSLDDLHSISLQLTAKLIQIPLSNEMVLLPLNFGWFAHHTFGSEYWVTLPDNYPDDYYWWSPGRNAGVFLGGEIKTKLLSNKTPASGTAFYIRVGTRGLYISSKFDNSSIPLNDIIEFGFGVAIYR
jgi:hypothetical protein